MTQTQTFLEALRTRHAWSYYRVARVLGVSDQTVTNWKRGSCMDEATGIEVARLLDLPPAEVVFALREQMAQTEAARAFWRSVRTAAAAVVVGFAAGLCVLLEPIHEPIESAGVFAAPPVNIMSTLAIPCVFLLVQRVALMFYSRTRTRRQTGKFSRCA